MAEYDVVTADDALTSALESAQEDAIAAALTLHVWPLLNGCFGRFEEAYRALPVSVRARHFPLEALGQLVVIGGLSQRAREVGVFDHRRASAKEAGGIHFVQLLAARLAGDYAAANRSATRLADWSRAAGGEGLVVNGPAAFFMSQSGLTELLQHRTTTAVRRFGMARRLAAGATLHDSERDALGKAALAHILRGSISNARRLLDLAEAMPLNAPELFQRFSASSERSARALIAVEQQSGTAAVLDTLVPLESADELWPFKMLALARDAFARESPLEALEFATVAAATQIVPSRSLASDALTATRMEALLAMDQPLAASRAGDDDDGILTRIARMQLSIRTGDRARARRLGAALLADADASPQVQLVTRLLAAWTDTLDGAPLSPSTATMAAGYAVQGGARLFTSVPSYVLDGLRAQLDDPEALAVPGRGRRAAGQALLTHPLTQRERRVLAALATTRTVGDISLELKVSPNTVKTQLSSLYRKLGVGSKAEAVAVATRLGLFDAPIESAGEAAR